jgi:hypothetical protein
LNILWIPTIGYIGSAWATLICYASMATACYWVGQKYYPVPYPIVKMLLYVGLAILIYGANLLARDIFGNGTIPLFIINTLLIISYLGIFYKFDGRKVLG